MIKVYIDSREKGEKELEASRAMRAHQYYYKIPHYMSSVSNLSYGDYLFQNEAGVKVCFEYKTCEDYLNSLFNGSLFEETSNMSAEYDYSYLILVGDIRTHLLKNKDFYADVNKTYRSFEGSLRRLRTYCNVIFCDDEESAFEEMRLQSQKCFNFKKYGGSKRGLKSVDVVDYTLSGCAGISSRLIENIHKQMPDIKSLNDLLNCSVEDFKQVHLIGEKKAQAIYEWIHQGE